MTRMDCNEVRDLIQAYDDGELPAGERSAVATHVQGCADCSRALADLQRLRAAIRTSGSFAKPAHLDDRIRAAIGLEGRRPARDWRRITKSAASHVAAAALGCALAYGALARGDARTAATRDIVTAHIRSLISEQLVHVASADTHTVKPWFVGRVPFSPDVRDLASKDFSLIGARQDYVLDRPAATIVYGRRKHRINLFILPTDTKSQAVDAFQASRNGYNLVAWNSAGFSYFATSDLNAAELAEFANVLRSSAAK